MRKRAGRRHRAGEEIGTADEVGDEAIAGGVVELALSADLLHLAVLHHHQPVGDRERLLLVVGHHDGGEAEAALQLANLHPDLGAELGVEVGERLVQQQDLRLDHQGAGERHPLLLAAGELARHARAQLVQAHQAQRLLHPPLHLGADRASAS